MEAGITLYSCQIQRNNGDLFHTGFFQCPPDKADVIGGAASPSCLTHNNSCFVQIVFAGQKCFHDLSYDNQRRVTCVIINIFQSCVHSMLIVIGQYFQMITATVDSSLHQFEMDWRHLGTEDRIIFSHFFRKRNFLDVGRLYRSFRFLSFSDPEGRNQAAET